MRKAEVNKTEFFQSPCFIYFMSKCCSTRISTCQEPAVWGRKPIRCGSSFSLCPSAELWALGSPSATAVSCFWSLISRVAGKCSQRGRIQQAPSVSVCFQRPVAGDAASLRATWDLSPCSPDILRESFSSGKGMKLKANELPREWGRLAAKQRRAVCCQTLSKILKGAGKAPLYSHGMWALAPWWLLAPLAGAGEVILVRPALTTPLEQYDSLQTSCGN